MDIKNEKDLMRLARAMAKKLDTPEMRELYRQQKLDNEFLNKDVDEAAEELAEVIKDRFKHSG